MGENLKVSEWSETAWKISRGSDLIKMSLSPINQLCVECGEVAPEQGQVCEDCKLAGLYD